MTVEGSSRDADEAPRDAADERWAPRRTLTQMLVVGVIASALGIALGLAIDWFPAADSTQAGPIDTLWDVLVIVSVPIFVLVTVIVLFSVTSFRMRPGEEDLDGPPIHGNTRLEVVWTALPAILIVALVTYAYIVLRDIEAAPASGRERVVRVTGEQFVWTFDYNERGRRFRSAQLYLPVGESVRFDVVSRDVIHDFWVPDFRMKIDAVPGIVTSYRVTPNNGALGDHDIVCAELCGIGHAYMRQRARVVTRAAFAAWVADRAADAAPGGGGGAGGAGGTAQVDGKALFANGKDATGAAPCGACHTLSDAGASGTTGPNLDLTLRGTSPTAIRDAIVDPDRSVPRGFTRGIMPSNYEDTLTRAELDALVRYLAEVAGN